MEDAFLDIYDKNNSKDRASQAYGTAFINMLMRDAIDQLVYNYTQSGVGNDKYTVTDCAATDAYFALPFDHQKYEYIRSAQKRQIMVVTMM